MRPADDLKVRQLRREPCAHGKGMVLRNYGFGPLEWDCEQCQLIATVARQQIEDVTGQYRAVLGRAVALRPLINCPNCGAPRETHRCSYCRSITP